MTETSCCTSMKITTMPPHELQVSKWFNYKDLLLLHRTGNWIFVSNFRKLQGFLVVVLTQNPWHREILIVATNQVHLGPQLGFNFQCLYNTLQKIIACQKDYFDVARVCPLYQGQEVLANIHNSVYNMLKSELIWWLTAWNHYNCLRNSPLFQRCTDDLL